MDPAVMSYDSRSVTSAPLHRPTMAPQFFPQFSTAPMTSMTAPQYLPCLPPVTFGGYTNSYTPTPVLGSPFRHYPNRPQLRVMPPTADVGQRYQDPRHSPSPSVKSDGQLSTRSIVSNQSTDSRTMVSGPTVEETPEVVGRTRIDALMKTIQAKGGAEPVPTELKTEQDQGTPRHDIKMEQLATPSPPRQQQFRVPLPQQTLQVPRASLHPQQTQEPHLQQRRLNKKRYLCTIPGCSKTFSQKTHLVTHIRSHTGEQPYVCNFGCGKRFSQLGNQKLQIHERRHTGERPYTCSECGKRFPQRGNLRAHASSHSKTKPYVCHLDKCDKQFTQLGNLKNKFHSKTLEALISKFATIDSSTVSKEDIQLWEYFSSLYKHSNKGIKGRGKHHKVKPVTQLVTPTTPTSTTSTHAPHASVYNTPHMHGLPQILNTPLLHPVPHHGFSHPASYSTTNRSHHPLISPNSRGDLHGAYEMFDAEEESVAGSGASTVYDDDHGRELAFGDRMY
ncbi:hypothetical protein B0H66DRAFT_165102 [Apodospora peruviana]|uniref:C2H2-type domain-containing protein n=1 Tax=Apodospora peruviana TaxID=516989 RepID=A0AAE0ILK1_9PEZI|nr:hypothetical protein B0H66DRAFT_165102 [Apodospora peruviana]